MFKKQNVEENLAERKKKTCLKSHEVDIEGSDYMGCQQLHAELGLINLFTLLQCNKEEVEGWTTIRTKANWQ